MSAQTLNITTATIDTEIATGTLPLARVQDQIGWLWLQTSDKFDGRRISRDEWESFVVWANEARAKLIAQRVDTLGY